MGSKQEQHNSSVNQIMTAIFTHEEITMDFYSCEEAITRLNDYLDHELTADERTDVMKHLQICQPCLERFRFEEVLLTQIRQRGVATVAPHSLRQRLGSALRVFLQQSDGH